MERQKTAIRKILTDAEINDCLWKVFKALPDKEQDEIQAMIDELSKIPNMGPRGVLGFLFAFDQAPELEWINEALKGG